MLITDISFPELSNDYFFNHISGAIHYFNRNLVWVKGRCHQMTESLRKVVLLLNTGILLPL